MSEGGTERERGMWTGTYEGMGMRYRVRGSGRYGIDTEMHQYAGHTGTSGTVTGAAVSRTRVRTVLRYPIPTG